MNKNLKAAIIVIAVLTVYSLGIYIFAAKRNSDKKENEETQPKIENIEKKPIDKEEVFIADYNIVLSPNTIIGYKNNVWKENKKFDYNNVLFDVYVNNEYKDKNYLTYNEVLYVYDQNKNFIDYEGKILAINTQKEYRNINFMTSALNDTDKQVITELLNEKGIIYDYDSIKKTKIIYDINNDGMRDDIYFISNSFEDSSSSNKAFSFGFIKYYDKREIFYEELKEINDIYLISNPYLQNIIEIENQIYFIVGTELFNDDGTIHHIYKQSGTSLKEVLKTSAN